jgi:hypothetical protein
MSDDKSLFPGRSEIVTIRDTGNKATMQAIQSTTCVAIERAGLTFSREDTTESLPSRNQRRPGSSVMRDDFIQTAVNTKRIIKITIA